MDKQKQIEILTEDIYMSGHGLDWEDSEDIAEQLYFLGYRKIPKDSVVLTKEEHIEVLDKIKMLDKIKTLEQLCKAITRIAKEFGIDTDIKE